MQVADRLGSVREYYFSQKLREIRALEKQGKPVINLGIGSPDLPPPDPVISVLSRTSTDPGVHQYQSYQGIPELKQAIGSFCERHFGTRFDQSSEILPLIGSKEGITHISLAYLNKGDQVLVPELGYLTYSSVTKMMEAEVVFYPLQESGIPDWTFFDTLDFEGIRLLWLNYPHMPTGHRGSLRIFEKFVRIAKANSLLLVHDNPYCFILNEKPISIFQVEEARDCALELHSLSKTFNMAGWRVGWVCGNKEHVGNILRVKSNVDSGMFKPIQLAAAEALRLDESWFRSLNAIYDQRRQVAWQILEKLDCTWNKDQAGLFVWAKTKVEDVDTLVDGLLYGLSVFITPGYIFGEKGRSYVRISLCNPVEKLEEALGRL